MLKILKFIVAGTAFALACQAHAGLFDDDEARKAILDLRQKLSALEQRSAEDKAQLQRSVLDISSQLDSLRAELATLRGQNEKLSRDLADLQRGQKDLAQGVNERLRQVEPTKVTLDGKEFMAEPAEQQEFEDALALLRKGEFAPAQTAFVGFLKRYPRTGYRPSALFWLGNAQYALRAYRDALANFRMLVLSEPEHARTPEALLSMANCQLELKDAKAARKTLEDLVKNYPKSEAALVAKDRLLTLR